ncbi:hypothetical protein J6590_001137 [Homalodisca vitripennis]|nr:hypothetical protein J6590_001137 [Homalodisca vitripennis]
MTTFQFGRDNAESRGPPVGTLGEFLALTFPTDQSFSLWSGNGSRWRVPEPRNATIGFYGLPEGPNLSHPGDSPVYNYRHFLVPLLWVNGGLGASKTKDLCAASGVTGFSGWDRSLSRFYITSSMRRDSCQVSPTPIVILCSKLRTYR